MVRRPWRPCERRHLAASTTSGTTRPAARSSTSPDRDKDGYHGAEPQALRARAVHSRRSRSADETRGRDVLEIGVGLGADHQLFARGRRSLDRHRPDRTRDRARTAVASSCSGSQSDLRVADAERCRSPTESFDLVYSWGVLHHSPDTPRADRRGLARAAARRPGAGDDLPQALAGRASCCGVATRCWPADRGEA